MTKQSFIFQKIKKPHLDIKKIFLLMIVCYICPLSLWAAGIDYSDIAITADEEFYKLFSEEIANTKDKDVVQEMVNQYYSLIQNGFIKIEKKKVAPQAIEKPKIEEATPKQTVQPQQYYYPQAYYYQYQKNQPQPAQQQKAQQRIQYYQQIKNPYNVERVTQTQEQITNLQENSLQK